MMSSPRDPRALKIRGALLYRDRRSQTTSNFQVLSEQHTGWEKLFVPSHWQEIRRSSLDMAWKNKSTRTWGLVWLNLPRILILSRDWSFPKRQEVSKVGQEKLRLTSCDLAGEWGGRWGGGGGWRGLAPVQTLTEFFYCPFVRKPVILHNKLTVICERNFTFCCKHWANSPVLRDFI